MDQAVIFDKRTATFSDYVRLARIDHWIKNIFVLPGVAVALIVGHEQNVPDLVARVLLALLATGFIASANYVINEWLDREFDRFHPVKQARPSVTAGVRGGWVAVEYVALVSAGLSIGLLISAEFVLVGVALLVMGLAYNVAPLRLKDRVYLDVLSESVNNPLRFLLGWFAVVRETLPPSSVLLAYWMGGAFLMAVKRYSEFRSIADPAVAGQYRRSFRFYTEPRLLVSAFFYALCAAFFLGIFLIKYRIEMVVSFPLFALMFTWYLSIGLRPMSAAQAPEKLYGERSFLAFVVLVGIVVALLLFVDMPWLGFLLERVSY